MGLVEFIHFYAEFIVALIVTRSLQIFLAGSWVSRSLGALTS